MGGETEVLWKQQLCLNILVHLWFVTLFSDPSVLKVHVYYALSIHMCCLELNVCFCIRMIVLIMLNKFSEGCTLVIPIVRQLQGRMSYLLSLK